MGEINANAAYARAEEQAAGTPPPQPAPQPERSTPVSEETPSQTGYAPYVYEPPPPHATAQGVPQTATQVSPAGGVAPGGFMASLRAIPWWVWLAVLLGGTYAATKLFDDEDAGEAEEDGGAEANGDEDESEDDDSESSGDDYEDEPSESAGMAFNQPRKRTKRKPAAAKRVKRKKKVKVTAESRFDIGDDESDEL